MLMLFTGDDGLQGLGRGRDRDRAIRTQPTGLKLAGWREWWRNVHRLIELCVIGHGPKGHPACLFGSGRERQSGEIPRP